jgi:hypothetical protein
LVSDPICSSAGCTQYKHKHLEPEYPVDYAVPNFGADPEVDSTKNSLKIAERMHNHEWVWDKNFKKRHEVRADDVLYNDQPSLDRDIIDSQHNLHNTESKFGHTYQLSQLNSDPICSSAGCWKSNYSKKVEERIVQYPDPAAQGLDSDIRDTMNHEQAASTQYGKVWSNDAIGWV